MTTEEEDLSFEALTFGISERDRDKRKPTEKDLIDNDEIEDEVEVEEKNVILVYTAYGGKLNPSEILSFAQNIGTKIINFNFRDKQCFGFLQFADENSVEKFLESLNTALFDGNHMNGERCNSITPGRDPRTHNSNSDHKNSTLVLKNLPFQLKQEKLEEILSSVQIKPLNVSYLYDNNGMFRGMAFVKYKEIGQGRKVFEALNGMDINGRKLRIEYKRKVKEASILQEDDVNHLQEQLIQFTNSNLAELSFPCVSSYQRRQIHQFAERLGLGHYSTGEGESRFVLVKKRESDSSSSSQVGSVGAIGGGSTSIVGSYGSPSVSSIPSTSSGVVGLSSSPSKGQTIGSKQSRWKGDSTPKGSWNETRSPDFSSTGSSFDRKGNIGSIHQQQIGSNPRTSYGGNISPFGTSNFANSPFSSGGNNSNMNSNYYFPSNVNTESLPDGNQNSGNINSFHAGGSGSNNVHPLYNSHPNNPTYSPTYSGAFQHGGPAFREPNASSPLGERHNSFGERGYPSVYNSIGSPSNPGQIYSGSYQRGDQGFASYHNSSNLFGPSQHTNASGYHSNNISSNSFSATPPAFNNNLVSPSGPSSQPGSFGISSYNRDGSGGYLPNQQINSSPFGSFGNQNSFGSSWNSQHTPNSTFGSSPPYRKTAPGRSSSPIIPSLVENTPISAVRQPKGPDGTMGFNSDYQRSRSNSKENKEIQKQMSSMSIGDLSQGESLSSSWTLFGPSNSSYPLVSVTSKSVDSLPFSSNPSIKSNPSPIGSPFSTRR